MNLKLLLFIALTFAASSCISKKPSVEPHKDAVPVGSSNTEILSDEEAYTYMVPPNSTLVFIDASGNQVTKVGLDLK